MSLVYIAAGLFILWMGFRFIGFIFDGLFEIGDITTRVAKKSISFLHDKSRAIGEGKLANVIENETIERKEQLIFLHQIQSDKINLYSKVVIGVIGVIVVFVLVWH